MAVFSAIGSIISSNKQSKAVRESADIGLQGVRETNALARDIFGQNKATLAPYVQAGIKPSQLIAGGLGYGDQNAFRNAFADYLGNSDYAFRLSEAKDDVSSGFSGAGAFQSGAALKALQDRRENLQSGYRNEFFNALGNQQALGFSGASAQAGVGQNYVNTMGAVNARGSDIAANAALAGANSPVGNAFGQVGGFLQTSGVGNALLKAIF